jgi:hypothetical protein
MTKFDWLRYDDPIKASINYFLKLQRQEPVLIDAAVNHASKVFGGGEIDEDFKLQLTNILEQRFINADGFLLTYTEQIEYYKILREAFEIVRNMRNLNRKGITVPNLFDGSEDENTDSEGSNNDHDGDHIEISDDSDVDVDTNPRNTDHEVVDLTQDE